LSDEGRKFRDEVIYVVKDKKYANDEENARNKLKDV
jgi:hypothetical protein